MNIMALDELLDIVENDSAAYVVYLAQKKIYAEFGVRLSTAILRNIKSRKSYIVVYSWKYAILIDIGDVNIANGNPVIDLFSNQNVMLRNYELVTINSNSVEIYIADGVILRVEPANFNDDLQIKDINRAIDLCEVINPKASKRSEVRIDEDENSIKVIYNNECHAKIPFATLNQACAAVIAQYIASTM